MTSQAVGNFINIDTDLEVATAWTTNLPLPDCLKVKIRTLIDSEKEQLAILDEEIHKLRQQHTHRSTQLERYQMCIAPHRNLPKEVLSEIFLWSLPEWGVSIPRNNTQAPWNIIHVCSLWRQLALNMPELWARVDLLITGRRSNIRAVQEVIGASKSWPLSIRVSDFRSDNSRVFLQQMIDVMFSHVHRLREIALRGRSPCIERFLKLPAGLARSLEIVKLRVTSGGIHVTDLSVLKGSTKLRDLTIDAGMDTPYSSLIQLPLAQLTALHIPCPGSLHSTFHAPAPCTPGMLYPS